MVFAHNNGVFMGLMVNIQHVVRAVCSWSACQKTLQYLLPIGTKTIQWK